MIEQTILAEARKDNYKNGLHTLAFIAGIPWQNVLSWWALEDYDAYVLFGITGYELARVDGVQISQFYAEHPIGYVP